MGAEDGYCCFPSFPSVSTTCVPDNDLVSVCPNPDSYGFQCDSGYDPASLDPYLNCSVPVPDVDGVHDDYCCTYQ
jgi:hypothetical protein